MNASVSTEPFQKRDVISTVHILIQTASAKENNENLHELN